jgi:hypothetical protein
MTTKKWVNLIDQPVPREEALRLLMDWAHQCTWAVGDEIRGAQFTPDGRFRFISALHDVLKELAYVIEEYELRDPVHEDEELFLLWEVENAIQEAVRYFDLEVAPRHDAA